MSKSGTPPVAALSFPKDRKVELTRKFWRLRSDAGYADANRDGFYGTSPFIQRIIEQGQVLDIQDISNTVARESRKGVKKFLVVPLE